MLRLRMLAVVVAAGVAAGCATMNVSSHVERGINFAQFTTYDWAAADALPTGDPRLDNNPFFIDYLTGAIERQLAVRGYQRATAERAQLLVHYHANISQKFEVHGIDRTTYVNCYPNCEPTVEEFEQGTIIVDVIDAATQQLLWRGWAQQNVKGLIDNQDLMQKHIDKSVQLMFRLFPREPLTAAAETR